MVSGGPRPARRRRRTQLLWYVLFAVPTLALAAMAAWVIFGGSSDPPAKSTRPRTDVELEAMVKKVDVDAGTVHLASEMLGIFGATLFVTRDTKVELADGKEGKIADLPEGARVRARYDLTEGRKMAGRIVVLPKDAGAEGRSRPETGPAPTGRR